MQSFITGQCLTAQIFTVRCIVCKQTLNQVWWWLLCRACYMVLKFPGSPRSTEPLRSPRQELTKQLPYRLWPVSQGKLKPGTQTLQGILSDSMKNTVDKCLILFSGCSLALSVLCWPHAVPQAIQGLQLHSLQPHPLVCQAFMTHAWIQADPTCCANHPALWAKSSVPALSWHYQWPHNWKK